MGKVYQVIKFIKFIKSGKRQYKNRFFVKSVFKYQSSLLFLLFRHFHHFFKHLRIFHRQLGKHFAVQPDLRFFQAIDEFAVGYFVGDKRRGNPGIPKRPEIALFQAAVRPGVSSRVHKRFVRRAIRFASAADKPLGSFYDFLVAFS